MGSLVSLYSLENTPCRGSQVKYRVLITLPSFFPIGSSRNTPAHSPGPNLVSPMNWMRPGLTPSTYTFMPMMKESVSEIRKHLWFDIWHDCSVKLTFCENMSSWRPPIDPGLWQPPLLIVHDAEVVNVWRLLVFQQQFCSRAWSGVVIRMSTALRSHPSNQGWWTNDANTDIRYRNCHMFGLYTHLDLWLCPLLPVSRPLSLLVLSLYLKFIFCRQHHHTGGHWCCTSGPRWAETACPGRDSPGNFATFCETCELSWPVVTGVTGVTAGWPGSWAGLTSQGACDHPCGRQRERERLTHRVCVCCPSPSSSRLIIALLSTPAHLGPSDHHNGPQVSLVTLTLGPMVTRLSDHTIRGPTTPGVTGTDRDRPRVWVT